MKLKKGSAAAKAYMAKIRAKRKTVKKVGEVALTKKGTPAKRFKKHQKEYNKDVDAYKYFVVHEGKVTSGYEFKSDALDAAEDYYPKAKILSAQALKKAGIPNPSSEWKYTLGRTKKVGSTLKLKANEKRLGATPKDIKGKSYHKDTKSHNVRISVMSGLGSIDTLHKEIKQTQDYLIGLERAIESNNKYLKIAPSTYEKNKIKKDTAFFKSKLAYYKKALVQLKKLYNKK